jgi:hypothetical protein
MGIAERKAAKQFEETHFPRLKQELDAAAGFALAVEADWNSLAVEGQEHLYEDAWPRVYFAPLAAALRALTQDTLGRESLQGALRRVVIRNTTGNTSAARIAHFQGGVLTLDHEPLTNVDQVEQRQRAIQQALETAPGPRGASTDDDPLRALLDWGVRGVDSALQAVARIAGRKRAGIPLVLPRVTLGLRSGRTVSGHVRELLGEHGGGGAVLLHVPREGGQPHDEAVIIPVGAIETVSILDVPSLGLLERGAQAVPTLLQVRRQLATLEAHVRAATGTSLDVAVAPGVSGTSPEELRALGFLAERTREVLEPLVKDEQVRQALREKVKRLHLRTDAQSSVSLVDGTLVLTIGRRPMDWYTPQELDSALQSSL